MKRFPTPWFRLKRSPNERRKKIREKQILKIHEITFELYGEQLQNSAQLALFPWRNFNNRQLSQQQPLSVSRPKWRFTPVLSLIRRAFSLSGLQLIVIFEPGMKSHSSGEREHTDERLRVNKRPWKLRQSTGILASNHPPGSVRNK